MNIEQGRSVNYGKLRFPPSLTVNVRRNKIMERRIIIVVAATVILFSTFCPLLGEYDYSRLVSGKSPLVTVLFGYIFDGGSKIYLGLGYGITDLQRNLAIDDHTYKFEDHYYEVGPQITYLIFPFNKLNKQETKIIRTRPVDTTP